MLSTGEGEIAVDPVAAENYISQLETDERAALEKRIDALPDHQKTVFVPPKSAAAKLRDVMRVGARNVTAKEYLESLNNIVMLRGQSILDADTPFGNSARKVQKRMYETLVGIKGQNQDLAKANSRIYATLVARFAEIVGLMPDAFDALHGIGVEGQPKSGRAPKRARTMRDPDGNVAVDRMAGPFDSDGNLTATDDPQFSLPFDQDVIQSDVQRKLNNQISAWKEKVAQIFNGTLKDSMPKVMSVPIAFRIAQRFFNGNNEPITASDLQGLFMDVYKIKDTRIKHPDVIQEYWERLPEALADPVMIVKAPEGNQFRVLTDIVDEKTNLALTVAFDLDVDKSKKGEKISKITNIHFEDIEGDKKWITDNLEFDQVVYLNIEKAAPRLANLEIYQIPNLPNAPAPQVGTSTIGLVTEQLMALNIPGKQDLVNLQAEFDNKYYQYAGNRSDMSSEGQTTTDIDAQAFSSLPDDNVQTLRADDPDNTSIYNQPDGDQQQSQQSQQDQQDQQPAKAWPENSPNVIQFSTIAKMKSNINYEKAKAGDRVSANNLVLDIMQGKEQQKKIRALAEKYPDAILVAVHAEEKAGRNAIPQAIADYIGKITGLKVDYNIIQTVFADRTGSDLGHRMKSRPKFAGKVQKGAKYILVDDVVARGGTFSEQRYFIESNGGEVVGMVVIGAAQFSTNIALSKDTKLALKNRFGVKSNGEYDMSPFNNYLKKVGLYGGNYEALTESEARAYLTSRALAGERKTIDEARAILIAKTLDATGNRRAETGQDGSPQVQPRMVTSARSETNNLENTQGRPSEGDLVNSTTDSATQDSKGEMNTDSPAFKDWFGDSQVVNENGQPLKVYHNTTEEFDAFDLSKARHGSEIPAFFFSPERGEWQDMGNIEMPVYLSIKNPYTNSYLEYNGIKHTDKDGFIRIREALIKDGYDGIIIKESDGSVAEYIAFHPEQIKSVDNSGAWDSKNPNIYNQSQKDQIRGSIRINPDTGEGLVSLFQKSNQSTFVHEMAHWMFFNMKRLAESGYANDSFLDDFNVINNYLNDRNTLLGLSNNDDSWRILEDFAKRNQFFKEFIKYDDNQQTLTTEQKALIAPIFEAYIMEDKSPNAELGGVLANFKDVLQQELLARSFETYLMEGLIPKPVFNC